MFQLAIYVKKTSSYLESQLNATISSGTPYTMAIITYALVLGNSPLKDYAMDALKNMAIDKTETG